MPSIDRVFCFIDHLPMLSAECFGPVKMLLPLCLRNALIRAVGGIIDLYAVMIVHAFNVSIPSTDPE